MRKILILIAFALTTAFVLSACNKAQQTDQAAQPQEATKPSSPTDMKGWKTYLSQIVQAHMQGINNTPYIYFIPAGDDPDTVAARGRTQETLNGVVATTVLPGNMIAAAGPDSGKTAEALITAFKNAQPGSFKGVVVLFVGDAADKDRVQQAVAPSGAEFRFAQM